MMIQKWVKVLIVITIFTTTFPYDILAQAGGSAVPFLTISPDARASGRGETGVAIADDINAIYWNPGGLAFLDYFNANNEYTTKEDIVPYNQIALSFSPWLPQFNADLYYSYLTYGRRIDDLDGTVAINLTYMNLGEFQQTFENGAAGQKFNSNEFSFGLSYGAIMAKDLGFGFQLKYINSHLTPASLDQANSGSGVGVSVAFDLGFLWKPQALKILGLDLENRLALGLNLQNVGPKMTYIHEADPIPTNLKLGIAYKVISDEFNDLIITTEMDKLLVKRLGSLGSDPLPKSFVTAWSNPGAEVSVGMEYWYEKIVAIRAGYFTEPAQLGNRKYWNFGAGVKYDMFHLDFSFINTVEENHPLANTMRFSMLIDFK